MQTEITRSSRNIGFGYTASARTGTNPDGSTFLYVPQPEHPFYVGTVKSIEKRIASDRDLESFRSGGTYYTSAWFVKVDGAWHRIIGDSAWKLGTLYIDLDGYCLDKVTVEYE